MIVKIFEYSLLLAYTHIARPHEYKSTLTRLKCLYYLHRSSIQLILFEYASNIKYLTHITRKIQIVWILQVLQIMWVNTCITFMEYVSNSQYLLALFVLLALFKLFELFKFIRVLNSKTHIDTSFKEYSTHIICIDSTQLTQYLTREALRQFFLYSIMLSNIYKKKLQWS